MDILMFSNLIYIPILNSNKYVSASIGGCILSLETYTKEEIMTKHAKSIDKHECKDFHDMCKKWGNKD